MWLWIVVLTAMGTERSRSGRGRREHVIVGLRELGLREPQPPAPEAQKKGEQPSSLQLNVFYRL